MSPVRLVPALALALLAGCTSLVGGPRETPTLYAPAPRLAADPAWPAVDWHLGIGRPNAPRILDGSRIAVVPEPGELQVYRGALWARSPAEMLEDSVLQVLEDSGRIPAVARHGSGLRSDYRLLLDIRHFEADYLGATTPSAVIEVHAKLLHVPDQAIAGNRSFRQQVPAAGTAVGLVADAFSRGLGTLAGEIAGWSLATGEAHRRQQHP